jgi:mannose-1-phosphate guanylyltransferase
MKAMIMAAGVGSRLMPMTLSIPKPMVPMGNRPLMEHIVKLLHRHGFNQVIANLHYHAEVISQFFGDGKSFGIAMNYSREDQLMGTAGGVKKCEWFLDDTFVIVSGDALTDINLTELVREHKQKGALATIALKEVNEVEQYGVVIVDDNGRIQSFQEKPSKNEALSNLANTGIYVFEPEIFRYIPPQQFYDFGRQVFPHMIAIGAPFYGVKTDGYWCDVGSINTYKQAHVDILENKVNITSRGSVLPSSDGGLVLLGEGVELGNNVTLLGNTVIGPGTRIDGNVVIHDAIIWDNVHIKKNGFLQNCIVGSNCEIGSSVIVRSGAAIASGSKIEDRVRLARAARM